MTLTTGCTARVSSEPPPVAAYSVAPGEDAIVYVDSVPSNIEAYPHYEYDGGYAYYVDGRWYRRGPRGWGYYRQEPPQLLRQRPYVTERRVEVGRAPPPPRERPSERPAPPFSRPAPVVRPPAHETYRPAPPANYRSAPSNEHER